MNSDTLSNTPSTAAQAIQQDQRERARSLSVEADATGSLPGVSVSALQRRLADYVLNSPENAIQPSWALRDEIAGTPLFDAPVVGCARADDPLFPRIKADDVILGDTFRLPQDWLPGAKSVISIFYPFSEQVRKSNWDNLEVPSDEWLHGRIEGHEFIHATDRIVAGWLADEGLETCIPALEPSLAIVKREPEEAIGRPLFVSSWSERHVAFVAGLGTFSLSAHLITRVGKAGRFGSIITTGAIEPTARPYGDDPYAYCTRCGACTKRCPVQALSLEHGKDYQTCWVYMEETKVRFKPRYGCGKCQHLVPCETGIPNRRFA